MRLLDQFNRWRNEWRTRRLIAQLAPTFITGGVDLTGSQRLVCEALGRIGEPAIKALVVAMKESPYAHRALGLVGGNRAFDALKKELCHEDWRHREAACYGLCNMDSPIVCKALPVVTTLNDDPVGEVIMAATALMKHIQEIKPEPDKVAKRRH